MNASMFCQDHKVKVNASVLNDGNTHYLKVEAGSSEITLFLDLDQIEAISLAIDEHVAKQLDRVLA
jgi:hypothetical protein